ncbi:hypothetical protein DM01DRAFT_359200 [Hesseltinella vesiculosa]|uniref:MICOS complex subunit MIC60 n=1 Tax=Hesseltinella vesiculosa TaxID=101127 RepID=A0A1X2GJI3_9FUNG|nr:hypothetical protein DM01DRAFT_359200 [Hesseltinella vesiculosa]
MASKLYQTTVKNVGQQRIGSFVSKRLQSTNTSAPKSSSFGKKLLATTVVTAAVAGGGVYLALNDPNVHDFVTTHVQGGEEALAFVKEHQDSLNEAHKQATHYLSLAKDHSGMAVDYATATYAKLTGDNTPSTPNPPSSSPAAASPAEPKQPEQQKPLAPPIVVQQLATNNAAIQELSRVVSELADILNDAGLADAGRDILAKADGEIRALNARWQAHIQEQSEILKAVKQIDQHGAALASGVDQLHGKAHISIQSTRANMVDKIQHKESIMHQDHSNEQLLLKESFQQIMAAESSKLQQQLAYEQQQALLAQAENLKRQFMQDSKVLIEHERAVRLQTLDKVYTRYKALEDVSVTQAAALDQSRRTHERFVALSSVQDCVQSRQRQPFREEWQALSNACASDATLKHVLQSVTRDTTEQGIATHKELADRYDTMAQQVRRVALVPEDGGFGAHIISLIMSKLLFKKQGLVDGDDVEAVLARSSYYLEKYDVENAARELNQLQGWPKRLAIDWIQAAREHLEVQQVLEIVETYVLSSSLNDA